MKSWMITLVLFSLVASASGQDIKQQVKKFRNGKRFSVQYDKFKDTTFVAAGPFATGNKAGGGLSGGIAFKGEKPTGEFSCYFMFDSYGRDWQFLGESDRELYALIDGERMTLGTGERNGEIARGFLAALGGDILHERIVYQIEPDVFRKLATGKSVELKVGGYEFKLKEEHQQAFRDLLSIAVPN